MSNNDTNNNLLKRQTLQIPGLQLSYLESYTGEEPLLLLHGLADHALVWQSLAQHLASDYHIVAPDLRGHGESSKPSTGYTSQDIIADLEALMDHLGWDNAHKPYKTYLKQLQITQVPGNHWAFLVKPEAFNQAVEGFLKDYLS